MASRALTRVAANVRNLTFKPRLSSSNQWRCLASTPTLSSNFPHRCTLNLVSQKTLPAVATWQSVRQYASDTMTVQELEDKVQEVLRLFDKVDPEKVTLEAHFIDDLGLDSLDVVEIVMAFEDELGVEISDEEAEKILSAKDAVELLKKTLDIH